MPKGIIGIRREDKNIWEKRVPLVPDDVRKLVQEDGLDVIVQPSMNHRAFEDQAYRDAGAVVQEDLSPCAAILGVKEIPGRLFLPEKCYVFFSHVIKGQSYNMPMLQSLLDQKCSLIDYEKIEDDQHRRLIFFGRFAGLAGMVESLHALGQRLNTEHIANPFSAIRQPRDYASLTDIKAAVTSVGDDIRRHGLPPQVTPLVCGFTGYGNVSRGAQEIYDLLPVEILEPDALRKGLDTIPPHRNALYKTVFYEKDMFEPADPNRSFDLQHYFKHPQEYQSRFDPFLPSLTMLINCIFWTTQCPRLVTKQKLREMYSENPSQRLRVIGDISCDIDGSVEATVRATDLESPAYVFDPFTGQVHPGFSGVGPVIMAIENLPCEIPVEASMEFSGVLHRFIPQIARADFHHPFETVSLTPEIKRAVIALAGKLTTPFEYIYDFLKK